MVSTLNEYVRNHTPPLRADFFVNSFMDCLADYLADLLADCLADLLAFFFRRGGEKCCEAASEKRGAKFLHHLNLHVPM